jgi:BRO family, N-terminal domain
LPCGYKPPPAGWWHRSLWWVQAPTNCLNCELRTANCELEMTEPGLYRLIFKSRKPVAKRFQRWVLHEVLPSIRKTGKYEIPQPQNILPLPPTDIRLVNFVSALSVIGIDTTNPRINQAVQDLVTNQIFGIQPQLSAQTERWQGVAEIAESIGYSHIARDLSLRSQRL